MRFAPLFLASTLLAQPPAQPVAPKFEVASIRAVPSTAQPPGRDMYFTPVLPGGRFIDSWTPLWFMIAFAYDMKNIDRQLVGLPDWAKTKVFSVSAKPADGFPELSAPENREAVGQMLRAMLEERFHLRVHTEMREESIFNLELAKGGFKIKPVNAPGPGEREGYVQIALSDSGGRTIGEKSTIQGICGPIALWLKRPVINHTGLNGYYDWDIRWSAPDVAESSALTSAGIGLLISMLQDRFGLQLKSATGPVQYWIVDHVEMPTDN